MGDDEKTHTNAGADGALTLAVDVGASHVKGAVLDSDANMITERRKLDSPEDAESGELLEVICRLAEPFDRYDRVSVAFPGLVRRGIVYAAPLVSGGHIRRFDLAGSLGERLARPVRVLNDAEMQGLGAITGAGVEVAITLGTGLGSAVFLDGGLGPMLQFLPSPHKKKKKQLLGGPYGDVALEEVGRKKWNKRIKRLIHALRTATNFDHLYIGGGNSDLVDLDLPDDVSIITNRAALVGGVRMWEWEMPW